MQIAPSVHRLGTNSAVNSYLVQAAGEVTIIDAAMPGFYSDIPDELAAMGRSIADVKALLLTHGHSDHIGYAERLRREHEVPVLVHEADAALARGEVPNPSKGWGPVKLGPLLGFLWLGLTHGGLRPQNLQVVSTFGDGATLDVPGSPKVILTPGHTPGSAALHFEHHGTLLVGDAFATYAVTTGRRGPQVAPFSADAMQSVASLSRLEELPVQLVLPGHGAAWTDGIAEAVRLVRASFAPGARSGAA
jgi:glyoxylase-like metal-dependent hydrolase (beta-lactamase superfamily II)